MRRESWISLTRNSLFRIEVKKSVFIAEAGPIRSAEDAQQRIDEIRKQYPDATHHVYAWRIGREEVLQKYSDDGEPSGTAGMPVLDALRKNDIDDSIIVVTRYFGGTQLGTGGLVRAYGSAAAGAVQAAQPCVFVNAREYEITVDFSLYERLKYVLDKEGYSVGRVRYEDLPVLSVSCPESGAERLTRICLDVTSGRSEPLHVGSKDMIKERLGDLPVE
ncbi:MAG: IMPACT family protein [Oscillospiraceae bacterium]|nr:IMPACT family protein [Oscillospiraceae bacterium]